MPLFDLPRFASSGTVVEPSEGKKDLGWVGTGEKPPWQTFNWLHKLTWQWINNLATYGTGYPSLASFVANADEGSIGVVDTFDTSFGPGIVTTSAVAAKAVDSDAEYWLVTTASAFTLRERTAVNTIVQTYTETNAVTTRTKAVTNGRHVAVIHDTFLEVFDRDTGASLFDIDHGGALTDVCIDNFRVYACGVTTANKSVIAYTLSTGVEAWSVNHDATPNSICTDGVRVYYGGNDSGGGGDVTAGHHIVALTASSGGVSTSIAAATVPGNNRMVCDGTDVYVVNSTTGVKKYTTFLDEIGSLTLASVKCVALDNDYFYAATATDTLAMDRDFGNSRLLSSSNTDAMCSDGEYVADASVASTYVDVLRRPSVRVRKWRRTKSDDVFTPYARLAIPVE